MTRKQANSVNCRRRLESAHSGIDISSASKIAPNISVTRSTWTVVAVADAAIVAGFIAVAPSTGLGEKPAGLEQQDRDKHQMPDQNAPARIDPEADGLGHAENAAAGKR